MNDISKKSELQQSCITAVINWFFCKHNYLWVRNVYGDEIYMAGKWKRSWWKCDKCNKMKSSEHLNNTGCS
jgi:hypothetical protein